MERVEALVKTGAQSRSCSGCLNPTRVGIGCDRRSRKGAAFCYPRSAGEDLNVRFLELFSFRKRSCDRQKDPTDHGLAATDVGTQGDQVHARLLKGGFGKGGEGMAILRWFRRVHVSYIGK